MVIFGLIAIPILFVVVFGKKIRKEWEFEAEFRDATGREFGEFEIESSMIENEDTDFKLRANLKIRHESITPNVNVQVLVEDQVVFEGMTSDRGRAFFNTEGLTVETLTPEAGQRCVVLIGGSEVASANLEVD